MSGNLAFQAFVFGLVSAVALPLGALTCRIWRPGDRIVAFLMAFGSGALLAALTIDLVGEALEEGDFYPLALGCVLGGLFFVSLNQFINSKGGFLRKAATTIHYLRKEKIRRYRYIFNKLSQMYLFNKLPAGEIQALIPYISSRTYRPGTTILRQGEPGDSLFIIDSGKVDIVDVKRQMKKIATLTANDVLGEMALVTGEPRSATAIAAAETRVFVILKEHFDALLKNSPKLAQAVETLVTERIADLERKETIDTAAADKWAAEAVRKLDRTSLVPTNAEIKEAARSHNSAPLAIWLGVLLDGIPESLVIGASLLHASISFSLIAGLFLSNYPEALSSSAGMRRQGYSFSRIFWMWTSLMLITGTGAYLGNIFFVEAPLFLFALIEGLAAGAMLTMIAQTMLPESFYKGGNITGIATLFGFLAAIFFKTLE